MESFAELPEVPLGQPLDDRKRVGDGLMEGDLFAAKNSKLDCVGEGGLWRAGPGQNGAMPRLELQCAQMLPGTAHRAPADELRSQRFRVDEAGRQFRQPFCIELAVLVVELRNGDVPRKGTLAVPVMGSGSYSTI